MNRGIRVLQTHALPLGYVAVPGGRAFSLPPSAYAHQQPGIQPGARPAAVACKLMRRLWTLLYSMHPQAPGCSNNKWSGRRGSNPLPPPWQGGALPDELRPHGARQVNRAWCLRSESNQRHEDFQSSALPTELQRHIEQGRSPARMRFLATRNGLEPSTSSVTGWRANRLHHRAIWP